MTTSGFTETIWHFAGYLRTFEDVVREQDAYSGDPQRTVPDEDDGAHSDRAALNKALLDTTARTQAGEEKLGDLEKRLALSQSSEAAIRRSGALAST